MAFEKRWESVPPTNFTSNGTAQGIVTIAATFGFKVKQKVFVASSTQTTLFLEVKRVLSLTQLIVGPEGKITDTADISLYTSADTANLYALEQPRPSIPQTEYERAVFEEEPTVAKRVVFVDQLGDFYDDANPLPIAFSGPINIGQVRIVAADDDPHAGDLHSSVRVNDGTNDLKVNNDGSINVIVTSGGGSGIVFSTFVQSLAVPINATEVLIKYTVPAGKTDYLLKVDVSGSNIATYDILLNGNAFARKRTYFGGDLSQVFNFGDNNANAFKLVAGDILKVQVTNFRPSAGDFEARIQYIEV